MTNENILSSQAKKKEIKNDYKYINPSICTSKCKYMASILNTLRLIVFPGQLKFSSCPGATCQWAKVDNS